MEVGIHCSSEEQEPPRPARRTGGWRAIKYILGNESFEKLASMSLVSNMTVYLRTKYNMDGLLLVNVVTIWSGSSNVASLAGAFISDAYLGRFLTLFFGSISSFLGMAMVTLTAGLPQLTPPTCHDHSQCHPPHAWQLGVLFTGLALLSIGAGGIRPCNIAFGADQFDTATEKGRSQLESFFNWWYLSFTLALLIALTAVVYIQTSVSWLIGFTVPTACLAFSIAIFLVGRHTYILKEPEGSVFAGIGKVIVASFRKRKVKLQSPYDYPFYDSRKTRSNTQDSILIRTQRFRFVEKAAVIVDAGELDEWGLPKNSWRLCSLQQVEQLKCILGIVPVWLSGICCFIVMDQQSTFGVLQALQMDRSIGTHFTIPPGWMGVVSMIALSIWILLYEKICLPKIKKILKKDVRLTLSQRIQTGILMSILCMVVAGLVEKQRRDSALRQGTLVSPVTVALLVPQFVLSGLTEAFAAIAIMEFLTTQMPETMRSVAGSIFFLSLSIASYLSSFIVNLIHRVSKRGGRSPWLGGHDLNKNRLEYYYYIIAVLGALNFIYFTFFACKYVMGGKQIVGDGIGVELENSNVHMDGNVGDEERVCVNIT